MPGVNYQRSAAHNRLFLSSAPVPVWSAFLLSDQSNFNQNSIDLTACWRERAAAFIFASQAPSNPDAAWLDALWQAILKKTPQFFWNALVFLHDPEAIPTPDNIWLLPIAQPATLQFRVVEETILPIGEGFAEMRFRKDAQVSIFYQDDRSEIRFDWPNFHPMETFIQGQPVTLQTSRTVTLPLAGPACGAFLFDLHLKHDEQLAGMDVGLKYFFGEKEREELHFPFFLPGPENTGIFFNAAVDPLQLLNPDRTFLAFTGEMRRLSTLGEMVPAAFDSSFKTLKGYPVRLSPREKSARLVFSRRSEGDPYYFVPAGDFLIEIIPENDRLGLVAGHAKWLTGYAGTETLLFPYQQDLVSLRFHPHQPAFAPSFPPPSSTHTNRFEMKDPLTSQCQTAWLSIVHAEGMSIRYIAQPDGGALYMPDVEDLGTPVFDYLDTAIPLPNDPDFCLPMVPHGAQMVSPLEALFENQVLSAARKHQVDQLRQTQPPATQIVHSATPQGLLIKLQPQGNIWTELLVGEDAQGHSLQFDNPPLPLQKAFQTNQQFLVVTNADNLGAFQNKLSIAGWPFTFNVGRRQRLGDYNNILIFKFCNESLLERIQNPALWTQPGDFNGAKNANPSNLELQLISRWLQDYINDALVNQKDNPYFQDFIRIVQNPRWNGVLALKIDIGLEGLPTELQGLVGGINTDRFNAHHVGMEINQVENAGAGELRYKEKSSLFGLVYYQDPNYQRLMQSSQGPEQARASKFAPESFDFRVLTLFALFKNSEVQRFSSKIRVTMRELFREKVSAGSADFIDLDGVHEKKNNKDTYTFLSEQPVQFAVDSALYQYVEIDRAAFITHPRAEGTREVRSYFSFIGNLLFAIPQSGFDILSFGHADEDGEPNPGLAFSKLQLDFSFHLDSPTVRAFAMQYPQVRFDLANSPVRKGSLLDQLPLEVKNFQFGDAKALPSKLGYLPVELAGLETAPIPGHWYGFECALHMGSAGDLSAIGNLVAPVLLAWGAGSKPGRPSIFLGLKLPGANADAKMLSIQGLLKLSIDNLQLLQTPQGFILKLNDISLKFFGLAKIPPGGSTSFYLFGNSAGGRKDIGWYAAYNQNPQP